jgi:hypothetical protein
MIPSLILHLAYRAECAERIYFKARILLADIIHCKDINTKSTNNPEEAINVFTA